MASLSDKMKGYLKRRIDSHLQNLLAIEPSPVMISDIASALSIPPGSVRTTLEELISEGEHDGLIVADQFFPLSYLHDVMYKQMKIAIESENLQIGLLTIAKAFSISVRDTHKILQYLTGTGDLDELIIGDIFFPKSYLKHELCRLILEGIEPPWSTINASTLASMLSIPLDVVLLILKELIDSGHIGELTIDPQSIRSSLDELGQEKQIRGIITTNTFFQYSHWIMKTLEYVHNRLSEGASSINTKDLTISFAAPKELFCLIFDEAIKNETLDVWLIGDSIFPVTYWKNTVSSSLKKNIRHNWLQVNVTELTEEFSVPEELIQRTLNELIIDEKIANGLIESHSLRPFQEQLREHRQIRGVLVNDTFFSEPFWNNEIIKFIVSITEQRGYRIPISEIANSLSIPEGVVHLLLIQLIEKKEVHGLIIDNVFFSHSFMSYNERILRGLFTTERFSQLEALFDNYSSISWSELVEILAMKPRARKDLQNLFYKPESDPTSVEMVGTDKDFINDSSSGLIELTKIEVLVFDEIAQKYGVSSQFYQDLIEEYETQGLLQGITSKKLFISIDFVIQTLNELGQAFDRVTWDRLMSVFRLTSEQDFQTLMLQVALSNRIDIGIDEVGKSIRISKSVTPPPDELPVTKHVCPSCGTVVDSRSFSCDECGEQFPKCIVCHLPILNDLTKTPCCGSYAHTPHIREWLKIKQTCPNCREKIPEWVLP